MILACVRTGTKYGPEYVYRLRAMVARNLAQPHRFVCFTDNPRALPGVETVPVTAHGWWAKMDLFGWQAESLDRMIYFDLDTVVVGSLEPLAWLDVEFGICGNFSKAAGARTPCHYGSCVMTMAPGFGGHIAQAWDKGRDALMTEAGRYGDQLVIERLHPSATILQEALPPRFFLGYRDLTDKQPDGCSLVIFAGTSKPHNCTEEWIQAAWVS